MILGKKFAERLSGGDWVCRACPKQALALGQARSLTTKLRAVVDPVKEVTACFEDVDLVSRDEGSALALIALDALNDVAILLWLGVDRQVASDQLNVAQAELLRPDREQSRCC
jgi:hypothetical protein